MTTKTTSMTTARRGLPDGLCPTAYPQAVMAAGKHDGDAEYQTLYQPLHDILERHRGKRFAYPGLRVNAQQEYAHLQATEKSRQHGQGGQGWHSQ
jgi:hypothetical protein